jgi:hypothetical protein
MEIIAPRNIVNDDLATRISAHMSDYKNNSFADIDQEHVLKWSRQFDEEQTLVLQETNRILQKTYYNETKINSFIACVAGSNEITGLTPALFWQQVSILDIQQDGNSQSYLVNKLSQKVHADYNVQLAVNAMSSHYIYLDDILFSGNRVYNDIIAFISSNIFRDNYRITIMLLGSFTYGHYVTNKRIVEFIRERNKNIIVNIKHWAGHSYENRLIEKNRSDVIWPEQETIDTLVNQHHINYIDNFRYRVDDGALFNIFSRERRSQFELAMLKAGSKIIGYCQNPSRVMKPLGFSVFDGYGFGSVVFTYNNCPNNNPLAFWWGNPEANLYSPLRRWYPLMRRRTYE